MEQVLYTDKPTPSPVPVLLLGSNHPHNTLLQIRPELLNTPRLLGKVCLSLAVLARLSSAQGSGAGDLDVLRSGAGRLGAGLESREELDGGLGGQVLVVVIVDLDHGRVDAGAEALDLDESEEAVRSGLALLDAEVVDDGLDDGVGAAAA